MDTPASSRKRPSRAEIIVSVVMIVVTAAVLTPFIRDGRKQADQTTAISSLRIMGTALYDFQIEYGRLPDRSTAAKVKERTGTSFPLGETYSNDYFRQLIAAGTTSTEIMFYARLPYTREADNVITSAEALAAGEVAFGYLMSEGKSLEQQGNPARPLAVAPLLEARPDGSFDGGLLDGKAVVLLMDNSVRTYPIRADDKHAMISKGKTLLETGDDTVWGASATPKIAPPLPK